jgi:hypothetical protein
VEFLSVHPREVAHLMGAGGERFTEFCNALIREMARAADIPMNAVADMLKVNVGDGGVDTNVATGSTGDTSGYLVDPTCWQFKATSVTSITDPKLEKGLEETDAGGNVRYVVERIRAGAGYRFCIADEVTAEKKNEIAKTLEAAKNAINPNAPPVQVLVASDLATQAERFPSIVLRFFRSAPTSVLLMHSWGANARKETQTYVPVDEWATVRTSILNHISLDTAVTEAAYVVAGDPGLGKTRLVFETLDQAGVGAGVLYTFDETAALNLATILANDDRHHAILVVDDCTLETKVTINNTLRGHTARVRAIIIEPYGERLVGDTDPKLEEMPDAAVDAILTANFPEVAKDRREAYRKLAGGYVRFAIGLCRDDGLIVALGVHAGLGSIDEYLRHRLTDQDEQDAVHALALVIRIGFAEDVREEIRDLCTFLELDPAKVRQAAAKSKDRPGFIARGGRYLYLSPEVVANAAFRAAWRRWAADDPNHFLSRIPQTLLPTFLRRVERSADSPTREVVGKFFFRRIAELEPAQLGDPHGAQLFATLVSAEPLRYLPLLRKKIEDADSSAIEGITGEYRGTQAPRRTFVWLAQRLIAFPEFFADAERILLQLALHESEPGIGNNATALWVQLFRIYLSGTATPFADRIHILRQRIFSGDDARARLAANALAGIFNSWPVREGVDLVFANRIAPDEWRPITYGDLGACYEAAVTVLRDMITSGTPLLRDLASDIVVGDAWFFYTHGLFKHFVSLVELLDLDEAKRKTLFGRAMDLVARSEARENDDSVEQHEIDQIRDWANTLVPETLHGRIVRFIATRAALAIAETDAAPIVDQLAHDLLANDEEFSAELPRLAATSDFIGDLGAAIGRRDSDARYAGTVLTLGLKEPNTFVRGYIAALLHNSPQHAPLINAALDSASIDTPPATIIDLAMAGGRRTRVLERALGYVRSGKLPAATLGNFRYGVAGDELSIGDLTQIVDTMLHFSQEPNAAAAAIGVIGYFVVHQKRRELLDEPIILQAAWQLVEQLPVGDRDAIPYEWSGLVSALAAKDAARAIQLAVKMLLTTNFYAKEEGEKQVTEFAQSHPREVMAVLGDALLKPGENIAPLVYAYTSVLRQLGDETVISWVKAHGLDGARAIARHLPQPYLDKTGTPVVPAMTAFVLEQFENDDTIYASFYSGTHNMRFYAGDIAKHHESEAAVADRFAAHPLRRIREWASDEREGALLRAAWFRQRDEEEFGG